MNYKISLRNFILWSFLFCTIHTNSKANISDSLVLPTVQQVQWANAEIGVIIHFDMVTFQPDYNWAKWDTMPSLSLFNPSKLNTDQWVNAAKSMGAKYAVLVAKHCSGFSLWPTKAHGYNIANTPWKNGKGDLVADFFASCKKYGIKPGLYCSASANGYLKAKGGRVESNNPEDQQKYNAIVLQQLTELWTRYGPVFEIWFDGGVLPVEKGGPDIAGLLQKLQPNAIVFQGPASLNNLIRWVGNEDGVAPYPIWSTISGNKKSSGSHDGDNYQGDPNGNIWCPAETDFPMRSGWQGGWFWKATDQSMMTKDELVNRYYTSVGQNTNMLLGIVIDTSGRVPDMDCAILKDLGREIKKRFTNPVAETSGSGREIVLKVNKPINHVIIQEAIEKGERIRRYSIEAKVNGEWKKICSGTSVGHKRIQRFESVNTNMVRLTIEASVAQPLIKKFAVYNVR